MSSKKHSFQCFNSAGCESPRRATLHHTTGLPTIPKHGLVGRHEPLEVCPAHGHGHTCDPLPFCLHQQPHQCVHAAPVRPEETHFDHGRHVHSHHRHSRRVVLVKNSDPSVRKTIVLHCRSIRSLGLFLEEVSELMQYNIRKLYTVDGRKVSHKHLQLNCGFQSGGRNPY